MQFDGKTQIAKFKDYNLYIVLSNITYQFLWEICDVNHLLKWSIKNQKTLIIETSKHILPDLDLMIVELWNLNEYKRSQILVAISYAHWLSHWLCSRTNVWWCLVYNPLRNVYQTLVNPPGIIFQKRQSSLHCLSHNFYLDENYTNSITYKYKWC